MQLHGHLCDPEGRSDLGALLDPVALRLVDLMPRVDAYDQRFFWDSSDRSGTRRSSRRSTIGHGHGTGCSSRTSQGNGQFLWFDPAAFALPGGGVDHDVFGTTPRNAIVGPGDWNVDAAVLKGFRVSADRRLELRFEAYNLFNHANLSNPVTNFSSADFGRILARQGGSLGNRRVQLGIKVYF